MAEQKHRKLGVVREVGLLLSVGLIVGNVVGDGIFMTVGPMLATVGPGLIISLLLAIIAIVFVCLYNTQLGGALPVTMADYVVTSRTLGPIAGWLAAWSAICLWVLALGIMGYGCGLFLQVIVPGLPILPVSLGIIILFGAINYFGIKTAARVQLFLTGLFVVLPLLVFIFGGWPHMQADLHEPLFPLGTGAVVLVAMLAIWTYVGFTSITTWAGELKNPRHNIPRTLVISLVIIAALYIAVAWVLSGVMPWQEATGTAVLDSAATFLPQGLALFIAWGAVFAILTSIHTTMIVGSRCILAVSRDNILPRFFSRINKFHAPDTALLFVVIIGLIGVLLGFGILEYVLLLIMFMMCIHIFVSTGVFFLPKKLPDLWAKSPFQFNPFWRWFTWIGMLVVSAVCFLFGIMIAGWILAPIVILALALGVAYWFARRGYLRRRGIILEEGMKELGPETKDELAGA